MVGGRGPRKGHLCLCMCMRVCVCVYVRVCIACVSFLRSDNGHNNYGADSSDGYTDPGTLPVLLDGQVYGQLVLCDVSIATSPYNGSGSRPPMGIPGCDNYFADVMAVFSAIV